MKHNKHLFATASVLLSASLLVACNGGQDEQEPDPTEEPSEQQQQDEQLDEQQNENNG